VYAKDANLSQQEMISITEAAFLPHKCSAEFTDYDNIFRFSVKTNKLRHFRSPEINAVAASNASRLEEAIDFLRRQILNAGADLDSWTFPQV